VFVIMAAVEKLNALCVFTSLVCAYSAKISYGVWKGTANIRSICRWCELFDQTGCIYKGGGEITFCSICSGYSSCGFRSQSTPRQPGMMLEK
jgi:hypothetical protein